MDSFWSKAYRVKRVNVSKDCVVLCTVLRFAQMDMSDHKLRLKERRRSTSLFGIVGS